VERHQNSAETKHSTAFALPRWSRLRFLRASAFSCLHLPQRQIARSIQLSQSTIHEYLKRFQHSGFIAS
jgi:DNA-binding MarR family transcriptional regulator